MGRGGTGGGQQLVVVVFFTISYADFGHSCGRGTKQRYSKHAGSLHNVQRIAEAQLAGKDGFDFHSASTAQSPGDIKLHSTGV